MISDFDVKGQYLKDMSIESPNSPRILLDQKLSSKKQTINVNCGVNVAKLNDSLFEVVLEASVKSQIQLDNDEENEKITPYAFIIEVKYAAIIGTTEKLDDNILERIFFVSTPNFLFPYVREKVSYASLSCGFPAVMLSPIDFETKYLEQKNKSENLGTENTSSTKNII